MNSSNLRRVMSDCPLLIIHQWIFQKPTFSTTTPLDIKQTRRKWRCKEQYLRDRSRAVPEVSFEIRLGVIGMTTSNVNRFLLRKTINFLKREPFCVTLVNILISHDVPVMAVFHVNTMLMQKYKPRVMRADIDGTIYVRVSGEFSSHFHGQQSRESKKGITRKYNWIFCNKAAIWLFLPVQLS